MSYPVETRQRKIQYAVVWIMYALFQALSLQWTVELPFWMLLIDALIHAGIFAFFGILLWNVILYGNYEKMPFLQQVINYTALAILTVLLWIGVGYGMDFLIFGPGLTSMFVPVIPVYVLSGIFIYVITVMYFRYKISRQISIEEENGPEDEENYDVNSTDEKPDINENNAGVEILERIAVKSGHKIHVVLVPDIVFLQADGDYVQIHTTTGKFLKEQTMKYFDENLPSNQFVRVHRSYIVNIESISRIEQYEKQNQLLTLKNGDKIKVSVAGYKLLKKRLGL